MIWANYSDLTRPHPKWWFNQGNPLISGKSRLVKYYNLIRCHYWVVATHINGSVRESPQNVLNSGLGILVICPVICWDFCRNCSSPAVRRAGKRPRYSSGTFGLSESLHEAYMCCFQATFGRRNGRKSVWSHWEGAENFFKKISQDGTNTAPKFDIALKKLPSQKET